MAGGAQTDSGSDLPNHAVAAATAGIATATAFGLALLMPAKFEMHKEDGTQ